MEKPRLYHLVPGNMKGTQLHPLNTLKNIHPEVYAEEVSKYADREHITEQIIPTLNAKWIDVLHFAAVHPNEIKKALEDAGEKQGEWKVFEIDPEKLDPEHTTIYLNQHEHDTDKLELENFAPYDPSNLERYATLPEETKQYYKESIKNGRRPLRFVGVPHILHKGSVDVSGVEPKTF